MRILRGKLRNITVILPTLQTILHDRFGVNSSALNWFKSYHSGRTQSLHVGKQSSATSQLKRGVPQGSIVGPVEFISYTEDLVNLVSPSNILCHLFADDTQLLTSMNLSTISSSRSNIETCISNIHQWCASRGLQLNPDKTELIWFGSTANLDKLKLTDNSITVGSVTINPSESVRDLGVQFDCQLSMRSHVSKISSICFYRLCRLR